MLIDSPTSAGKGWLALMAIFALAATETSAIMAPATLVSASAYEFAAAQATCPVGMVADRVAFSYWGGSGLATAPSGPCQDFIGDASCQLGANTTRATIERVCIGKGGCAFTADVSVFGNPCPNVQKPKFLAFCLSCMPAANAVPAPSPSMTASTQLQWRQYNSQICAGSDLRAACGDAGGNSDFSGVTLDRCKALCAGDPGCGGVQYFAFGGLCTKKCANPAAMTFIASQFEDTCVMLLDRLTAEQRLALPVGAVSATATATATGTPSSMPIPSVKPSPSPVPVDPATLHYIAKPDLPNEFGFQVPPQVLSIEVSLWGAGGPSMAGSSYGGAGAYVSGTLAVTPGERLRIIVGRAGSSAGLPSGESAIYRRNPKYNQYGEPYWFPIVVAGAGGGSSYSFVYSRLHGGAASHNGTGMRGGDLVNSVVAGGEQSLDAFTVGGGGGALNAAGRAFVQNMSAPGASLASGGSMRGGAACKGCLTSFPFMASGGSGFFGGGAGAAGGGGGSSLIGNLTNARGQTADKNAHWLAPGKSDPGYLSGYGDRDSNGLVAIRVPSVCDSTGVCYKAFGSLEYLMSFDKARLKCRALGQGWDLASIHDLASWNAIKDGCAKQATLNVWTAIRDVAPPKQRFQNTNNASSDWFATNAKTLPIWSTDQPSGPGTYNCAHYVQNRGLDATMCDPGNAVPCCSYIPPWLNIGLSPSSTPSPSTSPSVSPTPAPADAKGARYKGITGLMAFASAQTQCRALGSGWDLAAVYSEDSWNTIVSKCAGQLIGQNRIWTGLQDLTRTQRGMVDSASTKWTWSSSASTAYFQAYARSKLWHPNEPNCAGGEYCVELLGKGLNDIPCTYPIGAACCQYLPPGMDTNPDPSSSATPSPSVSVSSSRSASTTRAASATTSASATASPSTTPGVCDSAGVCYKGVRARPGTQPGALGNCQALGTGWGLASFYSPESWSTVKEGCAGTIPRGDDFWIGLYSPAGSTDPVGSEWTWQNNASTIYFQTYAKSSVFWVSNQPDNWYTEPCVQMKNSWGLNDLSCTYSLPWGCCQYLPPGFNTVPSVTPSSTPAQTSSPTGSGTATSSVAASPSRSSVVSRSPTRSPSSSAAASKSVSASESSMATVSVTASQSVAATVSATGSASSSASASVSGSVSPSSSVSPSVSESVTPSSSVSGSASISFSATMSQSGSGSLTATASASGSISPSVSASSSLSPSSSVSATSSVSPSVSSTPSTSPSTSASVSVTPSVSPSESVSVTASSSESSSVTASGSATATVTASASVTSSVSATTSVSQTPSPTASKSVSETLSSSETMTGTASASVTSSTSVSPSQSVEVTTSPSTSASQSVEPTVSITFSPSNSISPTRSASATVSATASPSMTASPSSTPAPKEERCRLGTSLIQIDVPGTLLISTPAEAINSTTAVSTLSCAWVITAPVGYRISLSFLAYAAQPNLDFLSAFDGASASSPSLLYMAGGGSGWAPRPITSTGRSMYVWFLSTAYFSSKGLIAVPAFIPVESGSGSTTTTDAGVSVSVTADNTLLTTSPATLLASLARPPPASVQTGAAADPDEFGGSSATRGNVFRCGPGMSSGNVNSTATIITTNPGLPVGQALHPTVDCTIIVSAPPGFVVALSYLNYTLAASRDYFSVFDGSSASSPALLYMSTSAIMPSNDLSSTPSDLEREATHLPPVVVSSGQYLYLRFQSVDFALVDPASGRPRGITAVVTFMQAPPARSAAAVSGSAQEGPNPLACLNVNLRSRPWNNGPNHPSYQISRDGGYGSLPPSNISVVALRGKTITLGYQWENGRASLKDRGAFTVSLQNCRRNCSRADTPAVNQHPVYTPDFYRKRDGCGLSGLCVFLWALTDDAGKLLQAPDMDMRTPITVPQTASYLSFGYGDLDSRDNSGSTPICIFPYVEPSPSPSPAAAASATTTPTPSPSASPMPPDVSAVADITLTLSGVDGIACVSSKACLRSAVQAVNQTVATTDSIRVVANTTSSANIVSTMKVVAAGTGKPPAPSNSTNNGGGSSSRGNRMLLIPSSDLHSPLASTMARHLLDVSGDASLMASDDVTMALLAAVAKDPLAPLWVQVSLGLRVPSITTSGRRLQASGGSTNADKAQQVASSAIAAIANSLASGTYQASFAGILDQALAADPLGEGADASLQAVLNTLRTPGAATGGVAFSSISAVNAGAVGASPTGTSSNNSSSSGLSGGAIAGIVVAGIALISLGVAGFFIYRKRAGQSAGGSYGARRDFFTAVSRRPQDFSANGKRTQTVRSVSVLAEVNNNKSAAVNSPATGPGLRAPSQQVYRGNPIHASPNASARGGPLSSASKAAVNRVTTSRAGFSPAAASYAPYQSSELATKRANPVVSAAESSPTARRSIYGEPPIKIVAASTKY